MCGRVNEANGGAPVCDTREAQRKREEKKRTKTTKQGQGDTKTESKPFGEFEKKTKKEETTYWTTYLAAFPLLFLSS